MDCTREGACLAMKRELLFSVTKKDFVIQTFQAGGKGGQHQNKTSSGVRIIHPDSGAKGESRSERSQTRNKRLAFRRLVSSKKFKTWLNRMVWEAGSEKTIDELVANSMIEENIKVEYREGGDWTECEAVQSKRRGEKC